MKPRKTWLHTAARALEAQRLNRQQSTAIARESLARATADLAQAKHAIRELSGDWLVRRGSAQLEPGVDAAYQRFHKHLEQGSVAAGRARSTAQTHFDNEVKQLRIAHSTQRVVERLLREKAEHQAHEARLREHQSTAEAWLLGQLAKDTTQ